MKVLVTGHDGYIGTVLTPLLAAAGHDATGLDTSLFANHAFGELPDVAARERDIRDAGPEEFEGFDAVIHLAALSNDPLGDLSPAVTYAINHNASVALARAAREAGVARFLYSSSCSTYGAGDTDAPLDEHAPFNPVTPYANSKVLAERAISALATDGFSPVFLRNATAYGVSPRMRGDIVVNNLVAYAYATGEVRMQSDGTPWRPLAHVEDIANAFVAALEAPRDAVHNEAFNIGRDEDNHQIRDIARMIEATVPDAKVTLAPGASPDRRSYRVDFSKSARLFTPRWSVQRGIDEMLAAYDAAGLTLEQFLSPRFQRIARIRELVEAGELDADLRRRVRA
ncbi:MAG TPA: SDR family oxidoreductase [Solirubrobacteraceae bacterium]|nr:SDR family oxidoreductase [Solirubrobacteraceae bacterium]